MRTRTRSPTPSGSPFPHCASASANPGSSSPWRAPDTASTPAAREQTMDRAPGASVRLKLTLSYAGFVMLAGVLLLAAAWGFLTRYPHVGLIVLPKYQYAVLREF